MENTDRPPTAQFSIKDNRRLIFQSRPISVAIKASTPAAFRFEGFEVVEGLKSKQQEGKEKTNQSYVVLFTTRVETEEDINKAFSDFRVIKSAIDATFGSSFSDLRMMVALGMIRPHQQLLAGQITGEKW